MPALLSSLSSALFPQFCSFARYDSLALLGHSLRSLLNQQTTANRKTIKALIPRVEGLAYSLSSPVPEGEVKEVERRQALIR